MSMERRRVILLGATGSIGASTLEVLRANADRLELVGLAARANAGKLAAIAREFGVRHVAFGEADKVDTARESGAFAGGTHFYGGVDGLCELCRLPEADTVLVAIVGTGGLRPTLAAIGSGKRIALASKEVLVLAGELVTAAARAHGVAVLPTDSEHNALFQCLEGSRGPDEIARLILTASGGPFRDWPAEKLATVTPAQALDHPTWNMGPKITVDSATLANKGLELIEARWLFGVEPARLGVVVHRQSIVHSLVEYVDGSTLAQLSPPSMTFPIQYALLYPERRAGVVEPLSFADTLRLDFEPPDEGRFPCLRLAREALAAGGAAPGIFNAANEVAVEAFLQEKLPFLAIPALIENVMDKSGAPCPSSLEEVLSVETAARQLACDRLSAYA